MCQGGLIFMQDSITEILRLVADGIIRPEEGQELLGALRAGYPEEFQRSVAARAPGPVVSAPPQESPTNRSGTRRVLDADVNSPGSDGSTDVADPWLGASQHEPSAAPSDDMSPSLHPGDAVGIPAGALLRLSAIGFSRAADAPMSSVAIRGGGGSAYPCGAGLRCGAPQRG